VKPKSPRATTPTKAKTPTKSTFNGDDEDVEARADDSSKKGRYLPDPAWGSAHVFLSSSVAEAFTASLNESDKATSDVDNETESEREMGVQRSKYKFI
jgi:hypothetical protein